MLNYEDYKKLISKCGEQFYKDYYRLFSGMANKSDIVDEILKEGLYGSNRTYIEGCVDAAIEICESQFVHFPGFGPIEKITYYDSHVSLSQRDDYLLGLVENYLSQLESLRPDVPKAYGLDCWYPDSCNNVTPNVCLSGEVLYNETHFSSRIMNEVDEQIKRNMQCPDSDDFIQSSIVLSDFREEYNTIVIYFNAVYEYAKSWGFNWEEVLFGVMAQEFFKANHYYDVAEQFENEDLWAYYHNDTSIGKMCTDVIDGMAQFYSYVMLDAYYGSSSFAYSMINRWKRNFASDDSYAQALYFMYDGSKPFNDMGFAMEKLSFVYSSESIMQSFYRMRFDYAPVLLTAAI